MSDHKFGSLLVSLGGNAIIPARGAGTYEEQRAITARTMHQVAVLYEAGTKLLLTHGNGPIVGNILIRNEAVRDRIPPMPLDVCGADSQGGIGYMMQQALGNEFASRERAPGVVTLVTQVVVSRDDPAFRNPTKPIGPFYAEPEARLLSVEKGWAVCSDAGRGFRRVVASPRPVEIVEIELIRGLIERGHIVIAVGGGGIPVVREPDGRLRGIEAVIDKDLASVVAATALGFEGLLFVTGVEKVALDFGKPTQRLLDRVAVSEIRRHMADGQFPPGSMGPKIEAAIEFVEGGGRAAIIASCQSIADAVAGSAGTWIVPG
jgi:carbamate kinase